MSYKRALGASCQNEYKRSRSSEESPNQQSYFRMQDNFSRFPSSVGNLEMRGTNRINQGGLYHINQQFNYNKSTDFDYGYAPDPFMQQAVDEGPRTEIFQRNNVQEVGLISKRKTTSQFMNNTSGLPPKKELKNIPESKSFRLRSKSLHLLTGSVENVLLWAKMVNTQSALFEVIGKLDYIRAGRFPSEKMFVLRGINAGPSLQVVFYEIDRPLDSYKSGSFVKVVGHMKSRSRLQAFTVLPSAQEEVQASQHVYFICDRAAQELSKLKNCF